MVSEWRHARRSSKQSGLKSFDFKGLYSSVFLWHPDYISVDIKILCMFWLPTIDINILYSIETNGNLIEHDWKLTASRSSILLTAIKKAVLHPDTKESDYWKDVDFQFYLNPVGRERIKTELANLKKAGWQVTAARHSKDKLMILV